MRRSGLGFAAAAAEAQAVIRQQAEGFTGDAAWVTGVDGSTTYRHVPNGGPVERYDDPDAAPRLTLSFPLDAGQYTLRARYSAATGQDDSFWVRAQGGEWVNQWLTTSAGAGWSERDWDLGVVTHTGGTFTLDVAQREAGAKFDWVELVLVGPAPSSGTLALGAAQLTVAESAGHIAVDVVRTGGSLGPASVAFTTVDDTATDGQDYTGSTGLLHFADGQTLAQVVIPILSDTASEGPERFALSLNGATGANLGQPRTVLITIDDGGGPGDGDDDLVRQAENFVRTGDWQTGVDGGTTYAHVPNGVTPERHDDPDAAPRLIDTFNLPSGQYTLRARVRAPNGEDDSFWLRVAGGDWNLVALSTQGGQSFNIQRLDDVPAFTHPGGPITLEIAQREAGTRIDWVELLPEGGGSTLPEFGLGIVEWELAALQGMETGGIGFASGSTVVAPEGSAPGSAAFRFIGPSGSYTLELAYFDENDGASTYALDVNQTRVAEFVADATNGGSGAEEASYRSRFFEDVPLTTGDEITLTVTPRGGEYGRADFLRIAAVPPDDGTFSVQPHISGLTQPTAIDFASGGLMFIAQQNGVVRVARNGVLLGNPFVDYRTQVNGVRDRGLLGVAVHPNFPNTPYVYLAFTYDPPETANFPAGSLGGRDGMGNRCARVVRLTANPATDFATALPGSDFVLLGKNSTWANISQPTKNSTNDLSIPPSGQGVADFIASDSESHTIGGLEFGPDGALYVAVGDGTSYGFTDPRTERVQSLDSLSGKILRVDPITGQGLPDNPFFTGDVNDDRSKVFAYGLRNPFRFAPHPDNGRVYIGDVGWTKWEEINLATGGENFGWPWYEGAYVNGQSVSQKTGGYQSLPAAQQFYASPQNALVKAPLWASNHSAGARAIVVGDIYHGPHYPAEYDGALFFSDYGDNVMRVMVLKADGTIEHLDSLIANTGAIIVEMTTGPDGYLYIVDITGRVHRIVYQ